MEPTFFRCLNLNENSSRVLTDVVTEAMWPAPSFSSKPFVV